MKFFGLISALCVCAALVACGDSDSTAQSGEPDAAKPASTTVSEEPGKTKADSTTIPHRNSEGKLVKPSIQPPSGPPPEELVVNDLYEGSGPVAKPGDEMTVEFFAVDKNGKVRYSSWGEDEPFYTFVLGAGDLFQGWDDGLEGMKAGGRREVIFPADVTDGLGDLFYIVDLLKIE